MTVFGLPVHPLVVHATVVVVPVAALSVGVAAVWRRFRDWASWGVLLVAVGALVLVPITTSTGEQLEHALPHSDLIERHSQLADGLLPWVIALAVAAVGVVWPRLAAARPSLPALPRWLSVVVVVIALAAAVGTLVEVVLIGHSGATAVWSGSPAAG